ncbi:MAG: oligosaccharide flippase family protein [Flavobacteriaceae bacterium]
MKERILVKFKSHQSLFIIVFGAVGFFITNIILKEKLNPIEYGEYSMVITFFSMVYIYGLLGLEQVLVKYSHIIEKNILTTDTFLIKITTGSILVSSIISSIFFLLYYNAIQVNPILFYISTACMISLLFLYSVFRLNSNFVLAQLAQNGFKIIFFVVVSFLLFLKRFYLNEVFLILFLSIIIVFLAGAIYLNNKIDFKFNKSTTNKTILAAGFYFLISTSTFSIINFADRYLIEYKLGLEKVGDYFYLSNIFLSPFSIFQGYIGFKKLVQYKNSFEVETFKKNNKTNLFLGFLLAVVLLLFYKFIEITKMVNFNFAENLNVILLLLALGIAKLYSSGIYPAFDVVINLQNLKKAKTLILLITLTLVLSAFLIAHNTETIILIMILIWITKTLLLKSFLLKQVKREKIE